MRTSSVVTQFDSATGAVTCLTFHPCELKMVTAGQDKVSSVWDIEKFVLESQTKKESHCIEAISFDSDGNRFYTAAFESLKCWKPNSNLQHEATFPLKWKGVKDLHVSEDNRYVTVVSTGPKTLTLWRADVSGGYQEVSSPTQERAPPRKAVSRDNIPNADVHSHKLSESHNEKYNMIEAFSEIRKEHTKFMHIMNEKHQNLTPITHWLSTGNVRAAINSIGGLDDNMRIIDLLNLMLNTKRIDNISVEFGTALLKKAIKLFDSEYIIHIKTSLNFVSQCMQRFKTVRSDLTARKS